MHEELVLQVDVIGGDSDREQFSGLLDRAFKVPEGRHFLDDFPIWDERFQGGGNSHGPVEKTLRVGVFAVGADQSRRLVASAGIRLAGIRAPKGDIPVALMGAVATDEQWRGRGLASQAADLALQWAAERGAAVVYLWGSEHSLYRRLGFELCGAQARIPLRDLTLPPSKLNFRHGWHADLFELLRKRDGGLILDDADRPWLAAHKNVDWWWVEGPREGAPSAYAAFGRGIDLSHVVHEWGGEDDKLLQLLGHVRELYPDAQLLANRKLLDRRGMGPAGTEEFLCMARVMDPVKILSCHVPELGCSAKEGKNGWILSIGSESSCELDDTRLVRLFFGPDSRARDAFPGGNADGVFPLPLWLWGLDGV